LPFADHRIEDSSRLKGWTGCDFENIQLVAFKNFKFYAWVASDQSRCLFSIDKLVFLEGFEKHLNLVMENELKEKGASSNLPL
jgi:hypothetical protein